MELACSPFRRVSTNFSPASSVSITTSNKIRAISPFSSTRFLASKLEKALMKSNFRSSNSKSFSASLVTLWTSSSSSTINTFQGGKLEVSASCVWSVSSAKINSSSSSANNSSSSNNEIFSSSEGDTSSCLLGIIPIPFHNSEFLNIILNFNFMVRRCDSNPSCLCFVVYHN